MQNLLLWYRQAKAEGQGRGTAAAAVQLPRAEIEAAFRGSGLSWAAARKVLLDNPDCSLIAVRCASCGQASWVPKA